MKILIFTSFYGSGYGSGYSAYKEANEFCKNGHDVTIVYSDRKENIQLNAKIKFIYLPKINKPFVDIIDYFIKLRKFSAKNDLNSYDIIYIQSLEFGLLDLTKIETPIFYFSRSTIKGIYNCCRQYEIKVSLTKKIIYSFLIILEKRLLYHCHNVFVKSNLMTEELIRFYSIRKKKIRVIRGGIDTEDFKKISSKIKIDDLKNKYKINSKNHILIYAGRIIPHKGLIYLIQSLGLLKGEFNFHLLIAGTAIDSLYRDSILKFVKKIDLENKIQFIGHVNQFEMSKLLNISSVVVVPSLYEPFGMINIQAAVLDKAIVTTKSVGSNEILSKYNKICIVEPASPSELASGIKKAMLTYDIESNSDLYDYSWGRVAHKILNLFRGSIKSL